MVVKFIHLYLRKINLHQINLHRINLHKTLPLLVGSLSTVALTAVTLTSAIVPSASISAELGDRSSDQRSQPDLLALQAGEVSVTGESGQYVGQVVATGSVDAAWAVLTDYNNFASFFPDVEESQLLESNGNQKVFYGKRNPCVTYAFDSALEVFVFVGRMSFRAQKP